MSNWCNYCGLSRNDCDCLETFRAKITALRTELSQVQEVNTILIKSKAEAEQSFQHRLDAARAEGYRAGLERAADLCLTHPCGTGLTGRTYSEAIRKLKEEV